MTRIYYATDIHGSERCYRKFLAAGKFYGANVLILGGDITGKLVVPLIKQSNGEFHLTFIGDKYVLKNEEKVKEMEGIIRQSGYYPYRTDTKEVEELSGDQKRMDEIFVRLMTETLEEWVDLAEKHLKNSGIRLFITGGNDDKLEVLSVLDKSDYIVNPEDKVVSVDEHHEMISTGYANITPFDCPRDIPEEQLAKKIEEMTSNVRNMENCIFNFHVPPYDSQIDTAPKLDENLKPARQGVSIVEIPVGSHAVREAIDKYQPLLGLHGHIHESRGKHRLGKTTIINPGSEYSEGILRGCIVNLSKDNIQNVSLVTG